MIIAHLAPLVFYGCDQVMVFLLLAGYTAAFSKGIQIFARIKTEASQLSQASYHFPFVSGPMGLCAVLHHKQAVPVCNLLHPVKLKGLPVQMNPDDGFCFLRDFFLDLIRIDLPCI